MKLSSVFLLCLPCCPGQTARARPPWPDISRANSTRGDLSNSTRLPKSTLDASMLPYSPTPGNSTAPLNLTICGPQSNQISIQSKVSWCSGPDFKLTRDNCFKNGLAEWFTKWASQWKENRRCREDDGTLTMDQPTCFFRAHLGLQDVKCSLSEQGCHGLSGCAQIAHMASCEEEARALTFVYAQYQMQYTVWNAVIKALERAEASVTHDMHKIVRTFSWYHDHREIERCEKAAKALGVVIAIFGSVIVSAITAASGVATGGAVVAPTVGNIINAGLHGGITAGMGGAPGSSMALAHNPLAAALCKDDVIAPENYVELQEERINVFTSILFKDTRKAINDNLQSAAMANNTLKVPSISDPMTMGIFMLNPNTVRYFTTNITALENDMRATSKAIIIGENLRSENCAVTCPGNIHHHGYKDCSVGCIRNHKNRPTMVRMFGADSVHDFKNWGFNEGTIIEESVKRYRNNGDANKLATMESILKTVDDGKTMTALATPQLPVCYAVRVVKNRRGKLDYQISPHVILSDRPHKREKNVTCVCRSASNEFLNETQAFYRISGLPDAPFWDKQRDICREQHSLIGLARNWSPSEEEKTKKNTTAIHQSGMNMAEGEDVARIEHLSMNDEEEERGEST